MRGARASDANFPKEARLVRRSTSGRRPGRPRVLGRSCVIVFRYQCYIAKETTANDYVQWNGFKLLEESDLSAGRFYLVAMAKPE